MSMYFASKKRGEWQKFRELPPTFERYGRGCVFVRNVLLRGGKIWEMNTKHVARLILEKGCAVKKNRDTKKDVEDQGKEKLNL